MFCCLQGTTEGGESKPTGPSDSPQNTHTQMHAPTRTPLQVTSQHVVQEEINPKHTEQQICTTGPIVTFHSRIWGEGIGVSLAPLQIPDLFALSSISGSPPF